MKIQYIVLALFFFLLSGFSSPLVGNIEDGIYTSAGGMFSLPVPVDLSAGGNGSVDDGVDNVIFTYMSDGEFSVNSLPHQKNITEENKHSKTKEALTIILGQDRPFIYEEYYPSVKEGTTFVVIEYAGENKNSPNTLGVGAFWTKTRLILVAARQSTPAFFLAEDKSNKNQIVMLKDLLIPFLKTVEIDN
jgi:hypothetical protein